MAKHSICGGDEVVSRFRFVEDHRDSCEVKWLCELLEVGRSSYYDRGSKRQGGQLLMRP